jgi:hypothetical protein
VPLDLLLLIVCRCDAIIARERLPGCDTCNRRMRFAIQVNRISEPGLFRLPR